MIPPKHLRLIGPRQLVDTGGDECRFSQMSVNKRFKKNLLFVFESLCFL